MSPDGSELTAVQIQDAVTGKHTNVYSFETTILQLLSFTCSNHNTTQGIPREQPRRIVKFDYHNDINQFKSFKQIDFNWMICFSGSSPKTER